MKKSKILTGFFIMAFALTLALAFSSESEAAGKNFTPVGQYYSSGVKVGKYYFKTGGNRWFYWSKKKNPSEAQRTQVLSINNITTNGSTIYGYADKWGPARTIEKHTLYKVNLKTGSKKKLKVITDKVNPENSSEDGFIFGNVYGNKIYYNLTQKLAKSGSSYVYTYKLVSLDVKSGKTKTVRKDFQILGATKSYLYGKSKGNTFYVFNFSKNKFYKITGIPKFEARQNHAFKGNVYGASYTGSIAYGCKKIVVYKLDGAKKKAVVIKTIKKNEDRECIDGFFEEGSFKYTQGEIECYKMNLSTKKVTPISLYEYDPSLAPIYD